METATRKTAQKPRQREEIIDAKSRIKPRGLRGMFKGRIILNGTDEEVFNLGLLK